MWVPTAATPFIGAFLKSFKEFPPRQGADTLSLHVALEKAMEKLDNLGNANN
jgi:arylsulfatase